MLQTPMTGDGHILHAIKVSANELRGNNLDPMKMRNTFKLAELNMLAKYLKADLRVTAIFVAIYVSCYNNDRGADIKDIAEFFNCEPFDLLSYNKQLEYLIKQGLVMEKRNSYSEAGCTAFSGCTYCIPSVLSYNILCDEPINVAGLSSDYNEFKFVDEVSDLLDARHSKDINTSDLRMSVMRLEKSNNLGFVKKTMELLKNIDARIMYYGFCSHYTDNYVNLFELRRCLAHLYDNKSDRVEVSRKFNLKQHQLIEQNLVVDAHVGGSPLTTTVALTDKGLSLFLGDNIDLVEKETYEDSQLINPEKIDHKELFFDEKTDRIYKSLINNLSDENFEKLQKRLADKHLATGVSIMLYGHPGTGKTEMVYQIARATGRQMFHVDISSVKDKYFGESEKSIRGIFNTYRDFCEKCNRKPILLFNEADGVFSKRKDVEKGNNCAQTENAIQNIILEEMEKLDGILIATTNLIGNLDKAFERRFLYKVHFNRPTDDIKMKIWHSKMPNLSSEEALSLAKRYDFSGGEIDNIVRKAIMNEILDDTEETPVTKIIELCEDEKFDKTTRTQIGFRA